MAKYYSLIVILILAFLGGGCKMATESESKISESDFYADTLNIVNILETCISEDRKIIRTEMNKADSYMDKYAKMESIIKDDLIVIYTDFIFAMRYFPKTNEEEIRRILQNFQDRLSEIRNRISGDDSNFLN